MDVEATGDRLGVDKLIAIGASVLRIGAAYEVEEVERGLWSFKVNHPQDFEPTCLSQFWEPNRHILEAVCYFASSSEECGVSKLKHLPKGLLG